jgi:hypothetical protein
LQENIFALNSESPRPPSAPGGVLLLAALSAGPAGLQQHQRQWKTGVSSVLAMPAAHRVLEERQALKVVPAEARDPETSGRAFGANQATHPLVAQKLRLPERIASRQ